MGCWLTDVHRDVPNVGWSCLHAVAATLVLSACLPACPYTHTYSHVRARFSLLSEWLAFVRDEWLDEWYRQN